MSGVVLTLGAILALTALVWRPKSIRDFPMSLGLIVVGSIAPYAFLWNGGYAPRFSIHFLPITVLSLVFVLNRLLRHMRCLKST